MSYKVQVNAVDDAEKSISLGSAIVPGSSLEGAKKQALDKLWDPRLDSTSCSATYDSEKLPGYIHGDWSHIFAPGSGPDTIVRLVYDMAKAEIIAMQIHEVLGWRPASAEEIADVQDSLKTANEDALANPDDWGLESSDSLPEWAIDISTHVFAVVRVKVLHTSTAGSTPAEIAEKIADAVAASPSSWMTPASGTVETGDGQQFRISDVEFASEVSGVLVDVIVPGQDIKEHHFDRTLESMEGLSGFATAREAELKARCDQYEVANNLNAEKIKESTDLVTQLYSALNDASSVVDKGDDEVYAYQVQLEAARVFLGITDPLQEG